MSTKGRKFIFVVMPFTNKFKNVYDYAIKQAAKDSGIYCERLDEQIFQESMLNQIYTQIYKADFIVADMSERNPNVFYEVGYAHAMDKSVILITNNVNDIPFDLKHYQHIVYDPDNLSELQNKLLERFTFYSRDDQNGRPNFNEYIMSIDGEIINDGANLYVEPNSDDETSLSFNIDFHNPTNQKIVPEDADLCLILPRQWVTKEFNTHPVINRDQIMMTCGALPKLLPNSYSAEFVSIEKNKNNHDVYYEEYTPIIIRVISKHGNYDKKVNIRFKKSDKGPG